MIDVTVAFANWYGMKHGELRAERAEKSGYLALAEGAKKPGSFVLGDRRAFPASLGRTGGRCGRTSLREFENE
ncbi:hypothetical protein [Mycetocola zhujimingii]|uniref:hypothetical protein n=1 Tax=Mycetocola zhujimingii TaxID=2079792 RepID=UPI001E3DED17|nr:hypothetical protein [Mycetocola zhujimingii]